MLSRTVALPVIVGAAVLKGSRLRKSGLPREARAGFVAGTATSFASTLASQELIRLVERDSALWPYAADPGGLAGTVLANLWRRRRAPRCSVRREQRPTRRVTRRPRRREGIAAATDDAYARAGVLAQGGADAAVAALVSSLRASRPTESRQVLASGHDALNVVRLDERTGIALSTDGVGDEAGARRAARPSGHGRHRLRGDGRQRHRLRRFRAPGDGRLPRWTVWISEVAAAIGVGCARGVELAGIEIVGGGWPSSGN